MACRYTTTSHMIVFGTPPTCCCIGTLIFRDVTSLSASRKSSALTAAIAARICITAAGVRRKRGPQAGYRATIVEAVTSGRAADHAPKHRGRHVRSRTGFGVVVGINFFTALRMEPACRGRAGVRRPRRKTACRCTRIVEAVAGDVEVVKPRRGVGRAGSPSAERRHEILIDGRC